MAEHARLSPSAAERWLTCTAAPQLEAGFPDRPSEYAEEGTLAHELCEIEAKYSLSLCSKEEHDLRVDAIKKNAFYTTEMQEAADYYANYIKESFLRMKKDGKDPAVFLEVRLDLTEYIPEGFGTADCIIAACGELHIIDFKYGKGVKVDPRQNKQMMIYALGAYETVKSLYEFEHAEMTIIQPRLGGISSWITSLPGLLEWGQTELRQKALEAYSGKGVFCPAESACRFCKAAGECRARADYYVSLFEEGENEGLLTLEETAELLKKAAGMKTWLLSIEDSVYEALMRGEKLPDWKLVEGRSTRKYTDEDAVWAVLKAKRYKAADVFEKKLIGITKMEKLVGKKKLAELLGDLIEKPKGKPTLAPMTDSRPEWVRDEEIANAFDEE